MNTPLPLIMPLINVVVTGIFAAMVLRQYMTRHRSYQLYWAMGLLMAFFATLAYTGMLVLQPASMAGMLCFRIYYILGILSPAWLGLGSFALISSTRVTFISLTILYLLSFLAIALILFASINVQKLSIISGTGTGILYPGPWLILVIILNSLGVIAVVGVAAYSGWKLWRRQLSMGELQTSNILWANVLILAGDLINALAGTMARTLGVDSTFWPIMALGWIVFFIGVLFASRRPTIPTTPKKEFADVEQQVTSS